MAGPGSAYSAPLSWVATRRAAVPGAWTYGRLVFPAVTLPSAAFARLSFRTWLSHDSWWHDRDATVVVSPDGTSWWVEVDQVQRSDGARWELDEVDLSAWANQTVRLGLTLNMGTDTSESTWLVDGVSIATASAWIDFLDPAADPDGDGIDSRTELGLGSLPLRADTDGDGVGDGADNCPIAVNPGQEDRVRPNGIGDACDDPDGDGFPDLSDLCPDQWAATNGDSDGDGVGDACDAHGDLALLATGRAPSVAPLGADVPAVWRLVDQDGRFRPDLEGVRVTLLAGEGARFGETAIRGRIIAGGGSSTVLVEFVEGLVELPLIGEAASTADLSGADTENLGIAVAFERLLRFDTDDGGLTHAPLNSAVDPWRWGPPPSGPAGAYSPPNCWGAADDGYSTRREGELRISSIVLPDAATALRFRSFYLRGYFDDATIELSSDGGATWSRLAIAADSGNAWREERIPLAAYRGRKVSIRFRLRDDSHSVTWYIDDLRFLERRATVRFVDPDADLDGDGISNGDEFEAGSDPTVPDGDADGVPDGADNCPLAPNADQADSMHPGGGGDACDDPDGDGLPDALDLCPDAYAPANSDRDGDRHGDACDPRPDIALRVELETSAYLLVGRPANATFRLIDQYGDVRTDLSGLRFGLRLSPGASFEGPVTRGVLIEGEGTSAVTVEFEDGVVELSILAPAETEYELWGEDVAGEGVAERFEWRTSFDNGNDGMTHASLDTTPDPWRRGTPTVGPGAAVSPPNAWSTALGAPPTAHANAYLATPDLALPLAQPARIEFWSWASPLPAYPSTRAYLEVSDDGGANWEALPALVRGAQQWVKESVDLSTWSGSTVRIRLHVNSGYAYVPVSWYLDDLSIVVGVYRLRSRDAASDPDSDGVDNEHELLRGSDPESADTDRDGVADGIDNCPSVSNEAQRDVVHPGAGGDACDDPDGDGLADESDFCPDLPIPETKDSDFDGLGNACDPYPDLALHAVPRLPEAAIVGAPARVTWELRDRDGGFHPELLGVRAELRLSGSAVFGETALAGRLLEGGGTARVLVEFVDGLVALEVGDGTAENVVLDLVDLDGIGIAARGTYLESFDAGPGGFVHEPIEPGALDLWALGPGPGGTPCYTAPSCWRSIDDAGFGTVAGALVSPVLRVTPGIETLLRFVSIKEPYHGRTAIEASVDGSPWFEIGGDPGSSAWQEAVHRIWYGPRRTIRFRFTHESIPGEAVPSHWAIDEFRLEGSVPTLLFLEGAADRDGDGISNAEELLVGGSTGRLDGDEDGFTTPGTTVPASPTTTSTMRSYRADPATCAATRTATAPWTPRIRARISPASTAPTPTATGWPMPAIPTRRTHSSSSSTRRGEPSPADRSPSPCASSTSSGSPAVTCTGCASR